MSQMVLGVLGGGQLGRMLALAAARLGVRTRLFDPDPQACGGQVAELVTGSFDDTEALARFCDGLTAATIEFENVPIAAMQFVSRSVPMNPNPGAVVACQDRAMERDVLCAAGFEVPESRLIASRAELEGACAELGLPSVLKARRLGYDGKGQFWIRHARDIEGAWEALGAVPVILDRGVSFNREISLLAVRDGSGRAVHYPPTENVHQNGILLTSCVPAIGINSRELDRAQSALCAMLDRSNYIGVLAVELFEVNGKLIANEMAPRVHNSGHWTMNSLGACQFENHVRAVLGLPVGEPLPLTGSMSAACMVNLIGSVPPLEQLLGAQGWHTHLYGKSPRAGRKLGHVNWCGPREQMESARGELLKLVKSHRGLDGCHV